jgi:hypothetical protein
LRQISTTNPIFFAPNLKLGVCGRMASRLARCRSLVSADNRYLSADNYPNPAPSNPSHLAFSEDFSTASSERFEESQHLIPEPFVEEQANDAAFYYCMPDGNPDKGQVTPSINTGGTHRLVFTKADLPQRVQSLLRGNTVESSTLPKRYPVLKRELAIAAYAMLGIGRPETVSGVRTTVTVHGASATTFAETLPRKRRRVELPCAPITMWSTRVLRA